MRKITIIGIIGLLCVFAARAVIADAPTQAVKWSRLPDMVKGLDFSSEVKVPSLVADDWLCQGGDVTDIHWWGGYWTPVIPGNYIDYSDARPNPVFADQQHPGVITNWAIKIYNDVPAGVDQPYSHPGNTLQWEYYPTSVQVAETFHGTTTAGRNVYQYFVDVSSLPFRQQAGTVYWLSIQATLSDNYPGVQWGWHESYDHTKIPPLFPNDAAVQNFKGNGWLPIQNNAYDNDMAFELTSVPEPGSLASLAMGICTMSAWAFRGRKRTR
jgi:hypothetical protein